MMNMQTHSVFQQLKAQTSANSELSSVEGILHDITNSKDQGLIYRAVLANTSDAIIFFDELGHCLDCNPAAEAMLGYSKSELDWINLHQLIRYHSEKEYAVLWKRFLKGRIHSGVMELQKKDGSGIKVRFNGRADILSNVHLLVLTDISMQLELQDQLAASNSLFKALDQQGADMISIVDQNGHCLYLSANTSQLLGDDLNEFIGLSVYDQIHPDDRSEVTFIFSSLKELNTIHTEPFRFKSQDGSWRWLRTIATHLVQDLRAGNMICNFRDITETVNLTKQIQQSNERYKLLMIHAREAIFDWDVIKDKIEWGSGFLDNFGYDLTESNSYHLYNHIDQKDQNRVWAEIEEGMKSVGKEMLLTKVCFRKANGDVVKVSFTIIFIRDQQGRVYRAVGSIRQIIS